MGLCVIPPSLTNPSSLLIWSISDIPDTCIWRAYQGCAFSRVVLNRTSLQNTYRSPERYTETVSLLCVYGNDYASLVSVLSNRVSDHCVSKCFPQPGTVHWKFFVFVLFGSDDTLEVPTDWISWTITRFGKDARDAFGSVGILDMSLGTMIFPCWLSKGAFTWIVDERFTIPEDGIWTAELSSPLT